MSISCLFINFKLWFCVSWVVVFLFCLPQYDIEVFKKVREKKSFGIPLKLNERRYRLSSYYELCIFYISLNKSAWNYIKTPNIEFSGKSNICLGKEK